MCLGTCDVASLNAKPNKHWYVLKSVFASTFQSHCHIQFQQTNWSNS